MVLISGCPFGNCTVAIQEVSDVVTIAIAKPAAWPCRSHTHYTILIGAVCGVIEVTIGFFFVCWIARTFIPQSTNACKPGGMTSHWFITPGLLFDRVHSLSSKCRLNPVNKRRDTFVDFGVDRWIAQ